MMRTTKYVALDSPPGNDPRVGAGGERARHCAECPADGGTRHRAVLLRQTPLALTRKLAAITLRL